MAGQKLVGSVGKHGKNHQDDSKAVQERLNAYIGSGRIGGLQPLIVNGRGGEPSTVTAISEFQRQVMKVPPTGLVRGNTDDVYLSLCKAPKEMDVLDVVQEYVAKWLNDPPLPKVPADMYRAALSSLAEHATHPRLRRYSMITMIDFRIDRHRPRLWVVDLLEKFIHLTTYVAHGKGSGGESAINFAADYSSKVGAYIATWKDFVKAGQTPDNKEKGIRGPAVRLQGLDLSNRRAADIGIIFHGAHYVQPSQGIFGNSRGCFATSFSDNSRIVPLIEGGSFVYAYAGEAHKPAY